MISAYVRVAVAVCLAASLVSCGNTIRGVGRDTSNTINATKDAARDVVN
jgi:entericidin B